MRAQRKAAKDEPTALAIKLFPQIAARYGLDVAPDLTRFIDRGEPIVLPATAFGPCFRVEWHEQAPFGRGWDYEATRAAGDVIKGVPLDSAAYRAGLRDGMKVLERVAGGAHDAAVAYGLRVRTTDGEERVIRYMPEGLGRLRVQRLVPTPRAKGCAGEVSAP
jgi:predicted metalloprotease with PDZ domain